MTDKITWIFVAGVVSGLIIGLFAGLVYSEWNEYKFGEMVCDREYGSEYWFTGYEDRGSSQVWGCQGPINVSDNVRLTVISYD